MIFSLCEPHTKYFNSMDFHTLSRGPFPSLSLCPHCSFVLYSHSVNWPHKIYIPINFIIYIYFRSRSLHLHLVSAILCVCPLFRPDFGPDVTIPDINLCAFCCCKWRISCLQFDNSLPGATLCRSDSLATLRLELG